MTSNIRFMHAPIGDYADSAQFVRGRFRNPRPKPVAIPEPTGKVLWDFFFNKPRNTVPHSAIPVRRLTKHELETAPDHSLYRLGHSTMLIKLRGGWWLTDPVFAKRASPFSFLGPKRFHAPPIALRELPAIRGVILSHDHYDHLDKASIRFLARRAGVFVCPLGVGDRLISWGVPAAKVHQLDWWQSIDIDGLRLTSTPAQHFSGRGLRDGNQTLWCSWVIEDDSLRIYFSGDSGYFAGFADIGRRLGPFDITLMETGAYNVHWPYVHMQPEETLQAHQDLRGRWLLPIHNGTFDLSMHAWHEPFERILQLANQHGISLTTPMVGERIDLNAPHTGERWWRSVVAEEEARHAKTSGSAKRLGICARC